MSNFNQIITNIQKELNNSTIVVAVSTGIDSMVLLDLLLKLNNVKVIAAHVNHHKRTQSGEEQTFIEKFCCERSKNKVTAYRKIRDRIVPISYFWNGWFFSVILL